MRIMGLLKKLVKEPKPKQKGKKRARKKRKEAPPVKESQRLKAKARNDRKPLWKKYGGVWWLHSPSKFTSYATNVEIIRFFTSRFRDRSVRLWIDDEARGHNSRSVKNFLGTVGMKWGRVLGLCTSKIQPADRPQANGKLKELAADVMYTAVFHVLQQPEHCHEQRFSDKLRKKASKFGSFSKECLTFCGKTLKEIESRFNSQQKLKRGVRDAFMETVMPPGYRTRNVALGDKEDVVAAWHSPPNFPHSKVWRGVKEVVAEVERRGLEPLYDEQLGTGEFTCKHGCGRQWVKESTMKTAMYKHKPEDCWPRRPELFAPLLPGVDPDSPQRCRGRLFKLQNRLGLLLDESRAVWLDTGILLEDNWWQGQDKTLEWLEHKGPAYQAKAPRIQKLLQPH